VHAIFLRLIHFSSLFRALTILIQGAFFGAVIRGVRWISHCDKRLDIARFGKGFKRCALKDK
jgi:hypothetical protein